MTMTSDERPWVVITGASEGIGAAFAQGFNERKSHNVVLVARSEDKMKKVAAGLKHIQTKIIVLDLASPGAAEKLFEKTKGIPVSLLINNAGMAPGGPHEDLDFHTIQKTIALNVTVLTELTSLYLPVLKKEHEKLKEQKSKYALSGLINISSTSAFMPIPSMALYAASKAFVLSFTESIHSEQRNKGSDLPVLCCLPGPVASEIWSKEGASRSSLLVPMGTMEHTVKATLSALDSNRTIIIPGYLNNIMAFSVRLSPRSLSRYLSWRFMGQDPALRGQEGIETMERLKREKALQAQAATAK